MSAKAAAPGAEVDLGVRRLGFLGAGKMAEAILRGALGAGLVAPDDVLLSDVAAERLAKLNQAYGVRTTGSNAAVVEAADAVVLAVRPQDVDAALGEVGRLFRRDQPLISIAAGVRLATLEAHLAPGVPAIRVMPNLPCLVGEAAAGIAPGRAADARAQGIARALFSAVGRAVLVPEAQLDAVTGLSGSGPAYLFLVLEALADGGVSAGLPREVATELAAQTMLGAARMVLVTGQHPGQLKDQVMSPAGTTAAGMGVLEARAVRAAFREAVLMAAERSQQLGQAAVGEGKPG